MRENVSRMQVLSADVLKSGSLHLESFFTDYVSSGHIHRPFCGACGAKLFWHHDDLESIGFPNAIAIMLGTLDHKHLERGKLNPRWEL